MRIKELKKLITSSKKIIALGKIDFSYLLAKSIFTSIYFEKFESDEDQQNILKVLFKNTGNITDSELKNNVLFAKTKVGIKGIKKGSWWSFDGNKFKKEKP